jgi:hypothetical protein
MALYRGPGGSGDATADSASEALLVRELAAEVAIDAAAAEAARAAAVAAQAAAELAETNAETAETNAETAEANAETAEANAETAQTAAEAAQAAAETAQTAAELAETNAETAETNAEASATAAASSASAASTSASNASTSATNASNSATAAATSATNSSNSATAAATSATNASNSATAASTSATAAQTAQTAAELAETNAETAETNAETAQAAAEAAQLAAETAETNAETAETNAAASASASATSATNASNSASAASTSATNASNSATAAATSATNAANSATAASGFADDASDSADAAAASAASINLSSIAITGGSINGTTVGASTASTGAFTSLSASGAFSANGGATLGDASGDALTINSSAVSIPNGLNFDSNTFVIDATNNRVGVGTASPSYPLSVQVSSVEMGFSPQSGIGYLGNFSNVPLAFVVNNSERMRLDSIGNLGVNTSSTVASGAGVAIYSGSVARLTLRNSTTGDTSTDGSGLFVSGSDFGIENREVGSMIFYTSNTERMRLDSSGNLGLGFTPSAWNSISKAIQTSGGSLYQYNSDRIILGQNTYIDSAASDRYINSAAASFYRQYQGIHSWWNAPSGTAGNAITFTQAMTLDASGNLMLGRTSSSNYRAQITGSGDLLDIAGTSVSAQFHNKTADIFMLGVGSGDGIAFATNGNTTERMRIDSSGNLLVGTTSTLWGSKTTSSTIWGSNGLGATTGATAGTATSLSIGNLGNQLADRGTAFEMLSAGTGAGASGNRVTAKFISASSASSGYGGYLTLSTENTSGTVTERLRIDSSGKLGIGTSSPGQKLTIGVSADASNYLQVNASSTIGYFGVDSNGVYVGSDTAVKSVNFYTVNTERMRIDSSGVVLVGTSSISSNQNASSGTLVVNNNLMFNSGRDKIYVGEIDTVTATTGTVIFTFENSSFTTTRPCLVKLNVLQRAASNTPSQSPAAVYYFTLHTTSAGVCTINGDVAIYEYQYIKATHFSFSNSGSGICRVTLLNPEAVATTGSYSVEILSAFGAWRLNSVTTT